MSAMTLVSVLAAASDLEWLHDHVEAAYRGDSARGGWTHEADLLDGRRTSLEDLAAIVGDPSQRILLLKAGDAIAGCVQVSDRGSGLAYLGLLAVDPERQAAGLGRRLLAEAERLAVEAFDARTMEMTVISRRAELIAYYMRRGYAPTGETRPFPIVVTPPLELAVLAKPLSPNPPA